MVDPTTTNRSLAVPTHGGDVDSWDSPVNANMVKVDTIVGGIASISTTGGNTTLNAAQLACGTISVSGALASNAFLLFPAVQGWWTIEDLTTNNTAFSLFVVCGAAIIAIGIPPGEMVDVQINGNTPKYRNLGRIGGYLDMCTSAVPHWISAQTVPPYLLCDGSIYDGAIYPNLLNITGSAQLPDFRGRAPYYLNGGSGTLTSAGAGIDGNTLKALGGSNGVMLSASQIPSLTSVNPTQSITVQSSNNIPVNGSINTVGTPGSGTPVTFIAGPTAPAKQNSSGDNSISVAYTNAGQAIVGSTAPGVVSGIRLIRAG